MIGLRRGVGERIGSLKLKVQLFCGDRIAVGPGKADLLDAITREGSISRAGAATGMSYRRAWLLVDEMNRCWAGKLVESSNRGGHLTATGHGAEISLNADLAPGLQAGINYSYIHRDFDVGTPPAGALIRPFRLTACPITRASPG